MGSRRTNIIHKQILGFSSQDLNMIAAESLLRSLITTYGKHIVYSDGGKGVLKHVSR